VHPSFGQVRAAELALLKSTAPQRRVSQVELAEVAIDERLLRPASLHVEDDTLCDVSIRDGLISGGALVRAEHPWADAQLASLYDVFEFEADVPLYVELARAQGPKVLEVACGSGRLVLPLARAGFSVVGIDASPHMLEIARAKLDEEPDAARRVQLIEADMRQFELHARFDLAIVAVRSFAYLTERTDQQQCLERIAAHLRRGGVLAIDLLHPRPDWLASPIGSMRDDLLQRSAQHGFTLSRVESVVSTDLAAQVRVIRSAYEAIDDHGVPVVKRFVEWPFRYTYRFEAEHMLERAGFAVEAVYGGYQRQPLTNDSTAMVFVARHDN
jgi:SAM-dependent methyltransferase